MHGLSPFFREAWGFHAGGVVPFLAHLLFSRVRETSEEGRKEGKKAVISLTTCLLT